MSKTFEESLIEEGKKTEFKPLADIPNEIVLRWVSEERKKDQTQRECLFVIFETEMHEQVKQKYTKTMWQTLGEDMKLAGGLEKLKSSFTLYRKKAVGKKGSFERLYPTQSEKPKKSKT